MFELEFQAQRQDIPALIEKGPEIALVTRPICIKQGQIELPRLVCRSKMASNSLRQILQTYETGQISLVIFNIQLHQWI